MEENTEAVSGLRGDVEFTASKPFAVADPVFSVDEHIRIVEPAETARLNGRSILYQRYHLCRTEQIPGYGGDSSDDEDRETLERYLRELREVASEYPEELLQLTGLEPEETSLLIHGEPLEEYDGEQTANVIPLEPAKRRGAMRKLQDEVLSGEV